MDVRFAAAQRIDHDLIEQGDRRGLGLHDRQGQHHHVERPAHQLVDQSFCLRLARTARDEGFDEIADWFETLAKAERSHAGRFQRALGELK